MKQVEYKGSNIDDESLLEFVRRILIRSCVYLRVVGTIDILLSSMCRI